MAGIQPQRLKQLLHRLIDIYSPSGKEREILEFLHGFLKRHGLPVVRQEVDERRYNLVVLPVETEPRLALVGHLDTVAAYDLDHYGYEEEGDRIVGLGAADMKGGCAAMVEAYVAAWKDPLPRSAVALALVVGEEEEGDGAQQLVRDFHFPWAIVGEPTDLKPCLSNYGYLEAQISVSGKRIHASLANMQKNPVELMLQLILKITDRLSQDERHAVYNIRDLFTSQAGFAVPDRCEAWLDIHVPPAAPMGEIVLGVKEILKQENERQGDLDASLRFTTVDTGYQIPEKGPVVEALGTVYAAHDLPWAIDAFRSHSDASELWEAGVLPIILGPGRLEKAHVPEESVSFDQVCLAAAVYFDLLRKLDLPDVSALRQKKTARIGFVKPL